MECQNAGELEVRLAETQQSLAVALARVEAYRCRERVLLRDYQAVLGQAREAGVILSKQRKVPIDGADGADGAVILSPLQQVSEASDDNTACAPTHLVLSSLTEQHPIYINTPHGRVPGTLLVAGNSLHFVEMHARVGPGEYLGLRALKAEAAEIDRPSRMNSTASLRNLGSGADSPPLSARGDTGPAGVLSGAANWLAQKVRVSGSGGTNGPGEDSSETGNTGLGFSNIMETIMHTLDDDSSDEAEAPPSQPRPRQRSSRSRRAAPSAPPQVHGHTPYTGAAEQGGQQRLWDIAWADNFGHMRRLQFEAHLPAQAFIHAQVQSWAVSSSLPAGSQASLAATAYAAAKPVVACSGCNTAIPAAQLPAVASKDGRAIGVRVFSAEDLELAVPDSMPPLELEPEMEGRSGILGAGEARAVAGALPTRHRLCSWRLLYSTDRHGISLQTLYRRSVAAPSLLFIQDTNGYVFGAFTTEGWRMGTRFFGTGETFVFQLRPHRVAWRWKTATTNLTRNDYFMFGSPESLAVGGGGHFALFLQEDLLRGSSGISATFGNACLASANEFTVAQVELWTLRRT